MYAARYNVLMTICPVVKTICEIRGAGTYIDDPELHDNNVIKIGGVEFVCDDMSFYIMSRKMRLARFELSRPSLIACEAGYSNMFRNVVGIDYATLYTRIIDSALKKKYVYYQFMQLVDLIGEMEQLIIARIDTAGRSGQSINISLPDLFLLPHLDRCIVARPDVLAHTMDKIIEYINKINVNALLKEPVRGIVPRVAKFSCLAPDMKTVIPPIDASSVEEFISGMHKTLEHEIVVASYIQDIEKYHCMVINHMNQVYDICKKIIDGLTS